MEKILTNHTYYVKIIFRLYLKILQIYNKKKKKQLKKMGKTFG